MAAAAGPGAGAGALGLAAPSAPRPPGSPAGPRGPLLVSRGLAAGAGGVPEYGAGAIQVLEGLEPVRKRPGMYIGGTGQRGLHHLVFEVVDNAVDEVQAGHARGFSVQVCEGSGWVTVQDDGRGIPTDLHPQTGKSSLETVLTVLHAGGKFGGDSSGYSVSGGLHGVGISVVNALSEGLEVRVWRGGREFTQAFSQGRPLGPMEENPSPPGAPAQGTRVRFRPDPEVFKTGTKMEARALNSRLRELGFLNSGAAIRFRHIPAGAEPAVEGDALGDTAGVGTGAGEGIQEGGEGSQGVLWTEHCYKGGLREYVEWMTSNNQPLHAPMHFSSEAEGGVQVEVALQWCSDQFSDSVVGYANSIRTVDGGTHLDGFKFALTRLLNAQARRTGVLKEGDPNLSGDHLREGLNAVVSVKVPEPEFEGQTKTRLGNPGVRKAVDAVVTRAVTDIMVDNPEAMKSVLAKALQALRASEAAKQARDLVRRKTALSRTALPGKLSDCSSTDPAESEILIVEGDSAGGTTKQARDRRFQAVLPLRGKILNVEKADDQSLYNNNEISNLIIGLGLGLKGEGLGGLRYHRIIILTDADVDGAHIRTLLLTFLFRYKKELFTNGHIYVGLPPLYKVTSRGGKVRYCYDDAGLAKVTAKMREGSFTLQRFKGLGEMMPQQLWDTTLNPDGRRLKKLTVEDAAEASHLFTLLMGDKVAPRRELIVQEARDLGFSDLDI